MEAILRRVRKLLAEDLGKKRTVSPEEIENSLTSAGWYLDGSFLDYLVIGYTDGVSILAGKEAWEPDDPVFELIDHERDLTYGVQEILTPAGRTAAPRARPATRGVRRRPILREDFAVLRSPGLPTSTYLYKLGRKSP